MERVKATARRARCDNNLKAIVLALDTYKQEHGCYPSTLAALLTKNYLPDASILHCPEDPRPGGTYDDFYMVRNAHDGDAVPIVLCPFHDQFHKGAQGFIGRYTTQYSVSPCVLSNASATMVQTLGQTQAVAAPPGMVLHGGDRILTEAGGSAQITFADGSTATLTGNCDVTVLESFLDGVGQGPQYTIVRQGPSSAVNTVIGDLGGLIGTILPIASAPVTQGGVTYDVHHGSKFDVVTPTATAGARGTQFQVIVAADSSTRVTVTVDSVQVTGLVRSAVVTAGNLLSFLNL
jgi:hypothetical protein